MIQCPKCGFEQPPDQYCARCGINMSTYKAPPKPLSRRLAGSGGFYMFLLVAVVSASIYFIFNRTSQNAFNPEAVQTMAQTQFNQTAAPSVSATPQTVEEKRDELAEQFKAAAESLFKKAKEIKEASSTDGTVVATAPTADVTVNTSNLNEARPLVTAGARTFKIVAHFLEIPQSTLATLFAGSDGGTSGIINSYDTKYEEVAKSENKPRKLNTIEKNIGTTNVPLRFDQILNENTGLYISVTPTSISENQVSVDISVQYRGINAQGAPANQEMENAFNLSPGSAAFFANPIPGAANIRQEELPVYRAHPVFKVLTSEAYSSNSSEFLVFFELQ